jgi:hypothetical protein
MENLLTIKNKHMKMSPGGVITLTVAARKALGMKINEPEKVAVNVANNTVVISKNENVKENEHRISKKGQMVLDGAAKELLLKSKNRHYWLKLDDAKHEASLVPY